MKIIPDNFVFYQFFVTELEPKINIELCQKIYKIICETFSNIIFTK